MKNYLPSIALVITFLIMLSIMPGPDYLVAQSITAQCSDGQDNDNDSKIDYPNDTGCQNTQDNDETNPPFDRALPGVGVGSGGTVGMIQYPISVLANQPNNYFIEKRDGVNVERVPLQVAALPKKTGTPLINGQLYWHLLSGQDQSGEGHIALAPGRHWDLSTLRNPTYTEEPLLSFFQSANNLTQCIQQVKTFPSSQSFLEDPFFFQLLLDLLTLCQR